MINKKFIQTLKQNYDVHEGERRQIISLSNVVLHDSKRVIFSLHRGDAKRAEESLGEIEKILGNLEKKFGHSRLSEEGAYKAGVEEYVEAKMLHKIISDEKVDLVKNLEIGVEGYLGGICDLTGELVRQAVNRAAAGKFKEVAGIKKTIEEIMAELVEFDMTGYLRTKYDQAKGNLRKIEQINYEINLRK
jgi:predicted translin family RNA/ssDNA-binding protein